MKAREYNFDGLIGPTHNFSGLSFGNIASQESRHKISHPRAAALQGLKKMKLLHSLGVRQGFIPPHPRPGFQALRQSGFTGQDRQILEKVSRKNPQLLLTCSSASAMWTANAATVSPSSDTKDSRVHITPANLASQKHRAIESAETTSLLRIIFRDTNVFNHHAALACDDILFDEGAANHMRLGESHGDKGIEVFVFGKDRTETQPTKIYSARQSLGASRANAGCHQLSTDALVFARQNPEVIDAGVFHNDVIAVGNENVLLYHERAFREKDIVIGDIRNKFMKLSEKNLHLIEITETQLSVQSAVQSYLFNSQIVTLADPRQSRLRRTPQEAEGRDRGTMALIAPEECRDGGRIEAVISAIVDGDNPIHAVHFVDLKESMRNGGGPACLRLRVVLTQEEERGVHPGFILNNDGFVKIEQWITKHYREKLHINDLRDYSLIKESRAALDELTRMLGLGSIYDFQK